MDLSDALRRNRHLGALDDDLLARLADVVHVDAFGDGFEFCRQGDLGERAYLVLDGTVAGVRDTARGPVELVRFEPGELFGLLALSADLPHELTCRSDGSGSVAVLERHDIEPLSADAPQVSLALQRAVGQQVATDFRWVTGEVARRLG